MAEIKAYKCDICGHQKGEANHWFVGCANNLAGVSILPWSVLDGYELLPGPPQHFCGLQCATAWMQRELSLAKENGEEKR